MPTKRVTRDGVFVSYSHVDKKWLERLKVHLKPLERDHQIVIWNDTKLRSGDKWRIEINKALSTPKVAILLVSADFLASDFIHKNELPPLLEASEQEGLIILPVLIGSCSFTNSPLGQFQAINDPRQPLNLLTEGQVDEVFSQLFNRVLGIFSTPAPILKPARKTGSRTIQAKQTPTETSLKTKRSPAATASTKAVKKEPSVAKPPRASSTKKESSPALLVKQTGEWEIVPVSQSQIGQSAQLSLLPATAMQRAFLTSLRQGNNLSSLVLGLDTFIRDTIG